MWRLPVDDEYREMIKSNIADIVNSAGRWGGAVTAAMFLKEFVGDTPWMHLDIAGMAWMEDNKPWIAKGPSGVAGALDRGVRARLRGEQRRLQVVRQSLEFAKSDALFRPLLLAVAGHSSCAIVRLMDDNPEQERQHLTEMYRSKSLKRFFHVK